MKSLVKPWLLPLALLTLAVLPAAAAAQNFKPVAVVSIASIKETLADVGYITKAAGMEDAGKSASFFASALTTGIDKEKPMGLYVVPKAGDFHAVAFIPLEPNGLSTILKVHKEQVGEPKDAGNGILEIGKDRTAFVREQGALGLRRREQGASGRSARRSGRAAGHASQVVQLCRQVDGAKHSRRFAENGHQRNQAGHGAVSQFARRAARAISTANRPRT